MGIKKRTIVSIIICVTLVLSVGIVVTAKIYGETKYIEEQLDLGIKYLEDLEYEQAIASFQAVITIDSRNVEAYIGIAKVYMHQGDYRTALEYVKQGYEITNSEQLQILQEEIERKIEEIDNTEEATTEEIITSVENAVEEATSEEVVTEEQQGWSERIDYEDGMYIIIEYDSQGRVIKETEHYQDGTTWFMEVTYNGNTIFHNYNDYATDLLEYDEDGRMIKQTFTYNDGRVVWNERIYDGVGNCVVYFYNSSGSIVYEITETEEKARESIYTSVTGWE